MLFNSNVHLQSPPGAEGPLPSWADLKFNPVGLYSLRRRLGTLPKEPGIFTRYKNSFLGSDIAWFAAGASEDNKHHIQRDTFHPLFTISRENLPIGPQGNQLRNGVRTNLRQLTFDLVRLFHTHLISSHSLLT